MTQQRNLSKIPNVTSIVIVHVRLAPDPATNPPSVSPPADSPSRLPSPSSPSVAVSEPISVTHPSGSRRFQAWQPELPSSPAFLLASVSASPPQHSRNDPQP